MTMTGYSQLARLDTATTLAGAASDFVLRAANPGDHHGIFDLLVSVFQAPSPAEYQAQLEDPSYEPSDRQVIRFCGQLVGHVRVLSREMRFGQTSLPVALVQELAVASHCRRHGFGAALVKAAATRARADGAVVGLARTTLPTLFQKQGWVPVGRHCYSLTNTRELLAQLVAIEPPRPPLLEQPHAPRMQPISTRIWRHVERAALVRLYDANTSNAFGPLVRTDDYWGWLISRRGYGEVYVAIVGPDKWSLDERPIVAYAVVKDNRIVELMGDPRRPDAVRHLVMRIGGDFIERDWHSMRIDAPPDSPLHAWATAAGGQHVLRDVDNGQSLMACIYDPLETLRWLLPVFERRLAKEQITEGELVLPWGDERFHLELTDGHLKLERGKAGRHSVVVDNGLLTQLLLGHFDFATACGTGRCQASTRTAQRWATALFPQVPYWHVPLDDLPA